MPVNSFEDYYMTWVPLKPIDQTPMYKSFAAQLEEAILSFDLAPNTLLPPQRELADYLDVNLSTITKAYKICEQKGYVYAVTGKGTFVSPNALLYKNHTIIKTDQINLRTVEPFHESDHYVEAAIKRIVNRPNFHQFLTYQTSELSVYHKLIAAKYLQSLNVPANPDNIILATGSQNALSIAMLSLFHAGDRIAVDSFTYHHFKILANFLRIQLYPIPNDSSGMIPDQLDFICRRHRIQGVYLMPSCSNPTAIEMPKERRKELANTIMKHNLFVLEDDSYRFLANPGCPTFYELLPDQTIYISSTTKSLSSGVRIAYLLYPFRLQNHLMNGERATNLHYTCFDAEIISELINSGDYIAIHHSKRTEAHRRNQLYNSIYGPADIFTNPYSFYRWLNIPASNQTLIDSLLAKNIIVMESQIFNAGTENSDHYLRIALSSEDDTSLLTHALNTLYEMLDI